DAVERARVRQRRGLDELSALPHLVGGRPVALNDDDCRPPAELPCRSRREEAGQGLHGNVHAVLLAHPDELPLRERAPPRPPTSPRHQRILSGGLEGGAPEGPRGPEGLVGPCETV